MARKALRLTSVNKPLEELIRRQDNRNLILALSEMTEELEYRSRYSKSEETILLQGALRALDDIAGILQQD